MRILFKPLLRLGVSSNSQKIAIWSLLESVSSPLFSVLLMPVLIGNLGLAGYGQYVILIALCGLFSFSGLGMSTAITYFLATNYQKTNPKNIAEQLGAALALNFIGTMFFSFIFVATFSYFDKTLNIIFPQLIQSQFLIYSALVLLIITQFDLVVSASIKALQRYYSSSKLEFFIRFIGFLVISIVAISYKDIKTVIVATLLISICCLILRYKILSRIANLDSIKIKININNTKQLFNFGKWMTLQNISGAIFSSLDKIILAVLLGSISVGIYNILTTITQLSHYVLSGASSFIFPKISSSSMTLKSIKKVYIKSLMICIALALFLIVILAMLFVTFGDFFKIEDYKSEYFTLLFSYGLLASCVPAYYFMLGLGRVKILSSINLISALLGIFSLTFLVREYGILGASLSRFIYSIGVALTLFVPYYLFKDNSHG